LRALARGEGPSAIAERFEVSRVWVYQVRKRLERTGGRESLPLGGHRVSKLAPFEERVRQWIELQPDLTLAEIRERLLREHGVGLKVPALWHQINKWGLSLKKNPARQRARSRRRPCGPPAVAR
jgi:transposase